MFRTLGRRDGDGGVRCVAALGGLRLRRRAGLLVGDRLSGTEISLCNRTGQAYRHRGLNWLIAAYYSLIVRTTLEVGRKDRPDKDVSRRRLRSLYWSYLKTPFCCLITVHDGSTVPPSEGYVVCAENLDSTILVMKTAENRAGFDRAVGLNRPIDRCILVQSPMCPQPIIVDGILAKDSPQMSLSVAGG
jgi:hypothetical protein